MIFKNNNIKVTYLYHIPDEMQSKLKLQPDTVYVHDRHTDSMCTPVTNYYSTQLQPLQFTSESQLSTVGYSNSSAMKLQTVV